MAVSLQGEPIQTSAVVGANGVVTLLRAATIVTETFVHICNETSFDFCGITLHPHCCSTYCIILQQNHAVLISTNGFDISVCVASFGAHFIPMHERRSDASWCPGGQMHS